MLKRSSIPAPGTPKLPADCVLVPGNGLSCVLRHCAGKNFTCSHTRVVPVRWRSAVGGAKTPEKVAGDAGQDVGPLAGWGEGAASGRPP